MHSATKYIGGHGTAIAGVIVDGGTFDYTRYPDKFPGFNEPDPSYHGLVYGRDLGSDSDFGANVSYIMKARVQLLRDLGPRSRRSTRGCWPRAWRRCPCASSATCRTRRRSRTG